MPSRTSAHCCVILILLLSCAHAQQPSLTFLEEAVSGEVDVRADVTVEDAVGPQAFLRIVFCYQDDANYLYFQAQQNGMRLGQVRGGADTVLASAASLPAPKEHSYALTIKRRAWGARVVCNGICVLSAHGSYAPGEKIGYIASGLKVDEVFSQPIGEMVFHDDFARPPGEPSPWNDLEGNWAVSLPDTRNDKAEAAKSANPFSFLATGGKALTVAGQRFWDGYRASVAVKAASDGFVGMAAYVQDPGNYYLFRVPVMKAEGATANAELVRVLSGQPTVLAAAPVSVGSNRWYELAVRAHDGYVDGLVDGKIVCAAIDGTFAEGPMGLYMEGCSRASFDDAALAPYRYYTDTYEAGREMLVETVAGRWALHEGWMCGAPDPNTLTAIGLTGSPQWRDYWLKAQVLPWTATSVGLCFGCTGPEDYYLFRWGPSHEDNSRQVQELWRIAGGKGEKLATADAALDKQRKYEVAVACDRHRIAVAVDGETVLETADLGRPSAGRVGYYAEGAGSAVAAFDNMEVGFFEPPAEPVSITEQFAKEDTMANWARPLASWNALGDRTYAYALPAFGDFNLRFELKYFVGRDGTIDVHLAANEAGLKDAPSAFRVSAAKDSTKLACKPPDSSVPGHAGEIDAEGGEPRLEIERRGDVLIASVGGQAVAWSRPDGAGHLPAVALKLGGVGVNLNSVTLTSPNIVDTSFTGAPTDWAPQSGTWEISDRWNCQPQWSWFCGRQAETPLIWSKQTYGGDMVFEFWACMMMDMGGGPGYSHPSDINGIICGDGKNLCSGYAFILAGDNNTCSKLIRKGETVGSTTEVRFLNPTTSGNLNDFHRHWFHCRLERTGGHLTYYVDGKKALEYDDAEPLPPGQVGIWTHQNNGILIARMRIAFQQSGG